jgi:carboxypeptidase T
MKLILLILVTISFSAFPQTYKEVKIQINNQFDRNKLSEIPLDLEHSITDKEGYISLFVNEDEYQSLVQSGLSYEILIEDWHEYYNSLPVPSDIEKELTKIESEQRFGVTGFGYGSMGGYYTFDEIVANLDSMYVQFPNLITQRYSIGTTHEGRTIWAVKISDNPNINEDEPAVGFDALVHAREPQSMATLMYFMWYLLENYGTNPEVTYLVNNREIYCVPCFNPDGYEYNRQTDPNGGGMWRKNRRNNGSSYGVDLNRNFGYMWGYDNIGSSGTPSSETYRGPSAFSEPEAQAVRDLAVLKNYGTHFNMHSYGNYFLYPWGYIDEETPDSLTYREFASDMGRLNGYAYGTGPQLLGYPSNGSVRDWMYGEQTEKNKTYGYTIEIGPSFWPSQSQIFPIAQQNVRSNMYQAFVAGEYVQLVKPNFNREYFLPADAVQMTPELRNKGLATAYNLSFELSSPSQFITITNSSASMDSLEARTSNTLSSPLSFVISASVPPEEEIQIVLTTSINGDITARDTTLIIIGYPVYIFEDISNDPSTYWTITKTPSNSPQWDSTYLSYYSDPVSYTDSKSGNYVNNATVTMTLTDPIDLTGLNNPQLVFYTKFDIESDWDYGQVQVSTNNGSTWIALEGEYTEPGVGSFQPPGEPVYDGIVNDWVKEEISLADYVSSQFKIRFRLITDVAVTRDGWYLDDIGIFIYTIPTDIPEDIKPAYEFSLGQNYPNPFNPATAIKYSIPEDGFVKLSVYNLLGEEVTTLVNNLQQAGRYEVEFDASNLSSGIYIYKISAGNYSESKKMVLLR